MTQKRTVKDNRKRQPNIVLINCDDLGYGDIGCYGSTLNRTPAIDGLARDGMVFTDFYAASAVCSPSRGAMLTGCYPNRIGFDWFEGRWVLLPGHRIGLNPRESSIATLLKEQGYATKLIGKWHCGDQEPFLPTRHGFDSFFGVPYSNDMGIQAGAGRPDRIKAVQQLVGVNYNGEEAIELSSHYPPLPLLRDDAVLQEQPDQAALTERYVAEAVTFIREKKDVPFFLYFAHMYVHQPLIVPEYYAKNSINGFYGAAVEHIDWSVAAILEELRVSGLENDTLVVFTSDNGSRARGEGGSNGPLRGYKGTTWEGGMRVPCVIRWPGTIRKGTICREVVSNIDLLPTFTEIAGRQKQLPNKIDGKSLIPLLRENSHTAPFREAFFFFHTGSLEAVRSGRWKAHLWRDGTELCELYDLEEDVGEERNIAEDNGDIIGDLLEHVEKIRLEIGDRRLGLPGGERRPPGYVTSPKPLTLFRDGYPYMVAEYDLEGSG